MNTGKGIAIAGMWIGAAIPASFAAQYDPWVSALIMGCATVINFFYIMTS